MIGGSLTVSSPKNTHTEGKPLTSPSTNLEIDPAQAILAANVMVRSFVLDFQQRATRDWEAAQQRWREQAGGGVEQDEGSG